jgi:hypothetical protein
MRQLVAAVMSPMIDTRGFSEANDAAALLVRHMVGNPCTESEIKTLFCQCKYGDANCKPHNTWRKSSNYAAKNGANKTDHHCVAMCQSVDNAPSKR